MILDLLIKINKIRLNRMISKNKNYEIILKQSQRLDKYITKKTIYLINKQKKKKMGAWVMHSFCIKKYFFKDNVEKSRWKAVDKKTIRIYTN